jgi:hypothetical protein
MPPSLESFAHWRTHLLHFCSRANRLDNAGAISQRLPVLDISTGVTNRENEN